MCSFLLGFGDSCFVTKIISYIGTAYPEDSAPPFAMSNFFQMLAASVSFLYSNVFGLHIQVAILAICSVCGTAAFFLLESVDHELYSMEEITYRPLENTPEVELVKVFEKSTNLD